MEGLVTLGAVGVLFARGTGAAMAAQGVTVGGCPFSGGPPGARAGTLSVMVSGDPASVERIKPMISLWGRTLTVAGDKPGAAQVLKLTNNILSAVALAATAEAFVMGAKGGLDPELMVSAISAGSGPNSAAGSEFPVPVPDRSFSYGRHTSRRGLSLEVQAATLHFLRWQRIEAEPLVDAIIEDGRRRNVTSVATLQVPRKKTGLQIAEIISGGASKANCP